jgi:hypothetical protein
MANQEIVFPVRILIIRNNSTKDRWEFVKIW